MDTGSDVSPLLELNTDSTPDLELHRRTDLTRCLRRGDGLFALPHCHSCLVQNDWLTTIIPRIEKYISIALPGPPSIRNILESQKTHLLTVET